MKLQYFHPETLPLIVGTILMIFCEILKLKILEPTVFWGIFIINTIWILYFLYGVINQITSYLGIYCFSIKKQETQKTN
jgi:predicted membrane protein